MKQKQYRESNAPRNAPHHLVTVFSTLESTRFCAVSLLPFQIYRKKPHQSLCASISLCVVRHRKPSCRCYFRGLKLHCVPENAEFRNLPLFLEFSVLPFEQKQPTFVCAPFFLPATDSPFVTFDLYRLVPVCTNGAGTVDYSTTVQRKYEYSTEKLLRVIYTKGMSDVLVLVFIFNNDTCCSKVYSNAAHNAVPGITFVAVRQYVL